MYDSDSDSDSDSEQGMRIFYTYPGHDLGFYTARLPLNATGGDLMDHVRANHEGYYAGFPRDLIGEAYLDEAMEQKLDLEHPLHPNSSVYIAVMKNVNCWYYDEMKTYKLPENTTVLDVMNHVMENSDINDWLWVLTVGGLYRDGFYRRKLEDDYILPDDYDVYLKVEVRVEINTMYSKLGELDVPMEATFRQFKQLIGKKFGPEYEKMRVGIRYAGVVEMLTIPDHMRLYQWNEYTNDLNGGLMNYTEIVLAE